MRTKANPIHFFLYTVHVSKILTHFMDKKPSKQWQSASKPKATGCSPWLDLLQILLLPFGYILESLQERMAESRCHCSFTVTGITTQDSHRLYRPDRMDEAGYETEISLLLSRTAYSVCGWRVRDSKRWRAPGRFSGVRNRKGEEGVEKQMTARGIRRTG